MGGGRVISSGDAVFLEAHTGKLVHVQDTAVRAQWTDYGEWQKLIIQRKEGPGPVMPGDTIFLIAHTGKMIDVAHDAVQARWFDEGLWQSLVIERKKHVLRRLTRAEQKKEQGV